jgi:hypothetical protein
MGTSRRRIRFEIASTYPHSTAVRLDALGRHRGPV